jgi:hypothetical protein
MRSEPSRSSPRKSKPPSFSSFRASSHLPGRRRCIGRMRRHAPHIQSLDFEMVDNAEASPPKFFSAFEESTVRCLSEARGRSAYAAQNAVRHLRQAWRIRHLDSQMAAFRAITAEEEAATAIIRTLQERGYSGAESADPHKHTVKQALFPLVLETSHAMRPFTEIIKTSVRIEQRNDRPVMDLLYTLPTGESFSSVPPLGIAWQSTPIDGLPVDRVMALPDSSYDATLTVSAPVAEHPNLKPDVLREGALNLAATLEARLSSKANAAGYHKFLAQLKKEANIRNRLLYAGDDGWPGEVKDIEDVLNARRRRTFILLIIYCLLFPHSERSVLAQQVLIALNLLTERLTKEEINW